MPPTSESPQALTDDTSPATRAAAAGSDVHLRPPSLQDGAQMWRVARDSGSLELNTSYAYLLFARDFADTCRVAVVDGEVAGFILGYRRPTEPRTVFVWQVAVDARYRGRRLAAYLLDSIAEGAEHVEATITADNTASQRLFESFAERHGAELTRSEMFSANHFPDTHDAEGLVRIGPLRITDI